MFCVFKPKKEKTIHHDGFHHGVNTHPVYPLGFLLFLRVGVVQDLAFFPRDDHRLVAMATLFRGPIDTTATVDDVADKIPVDHMTGYDSLEGKRKLLKGLDGLRDEEEDVEGY